MGDAARGTENGGFWTQRTTASVRCLLHAAALAGRPPSDLYRWSLSAPNAREAVEILRSDASATAGWAIPALDSHIREMAEYGFTMWQRAGRTISAAFADAGSPVASLERLEPPPPTLHLYAQPADPAFLEAQRQYASGHQWFRVHRLDARSHFPMFEVPDEMGDVIESFVAAL